MTDNMKYIVNTVTGMINSKFGDELPTIEDIHKEAETIRAAFSAIYPVTDEEFAQIKITLSSNILHSIGVAITLRGRDSAHQSWYFVQENDGFYWNRYKNYLKNNKRF